MKNYKRYALVVVAAFIALLVFVDWFEGCSSEKRDTIRIRVPEKKGTFKPKKPTHHTIDSIKPEKTIRYVIAPANNSEAEYWKAEYEKALSESKSMLDRYNLANENLKKELYVKSIEVKAFKQEFDNDTINITISGLARGELLSMKPSWVIKPSKEEVPLPKISRVLIGAEVGNSLDLTQFVVKGNLYFQNSNGDIFSLSADTQQRFWAGYSKTLFKIKSRKATKSNTK